MLFYSLFYCRVRDARDSIRLKRRNEKPDLTSTGRRSVAPR